MSRTDAEPLRPLMLEGPSDAEGWVQERVTYRVTPRPKSKFKTVIDVAEMIGADGRSRSEITTRVRLEAAPGEVVQVVTSEHRLNGSRLTERLELIRLDGSEPTMRAGRFQRTHCGDGGDLLRQEQAQLGAGVGLPVATYPEVVIPFLLRGQPRDRRKRALYSWTSDRFVARVYYEARSKKRIAVPAGTFDCVECWMYPDLNDWIAMGGLLTKLAKPMLPRYSMWFEREPPWRTVRFEGPLGPPGAPEIVLELL